MLSDTAESWDVVRKVHIKCDLLGEKFDTICRLQSTSPLRHDVDIVDAYRLFEEKHADK